MEKIFELLNQYHLGGQKEEGLKIPHLKYEQKTSDGKNIISYNFVVQYDELLQENLFDADNLEESFYAFEKKYFSKYFFREDTDLKWNYYLIVIVSEEESMNSEICQLEQDDKFLRKLVMTLDEFETYIDYGKQTVRGSNPDINGIDTYAEWQRALSAANLEGILSLPYESRKVKSYLEKGTPIRQQGRPIKKWEINDMANLKYSIQKLDSIFIENYRNHCLLPGLVIPLSKVNLISGHNGTGKSSICSAIEYAITGEIADIEDESGSTTVNIINRKNQPEILKSIVSVKERKAFDKLWYGTNTTARKSSLNRNFHIFNYLGLDAAGKYMQNLEIDDLVKNVLFGTEVTEAEMKMNRYGKEFTDCKKGYEKQLRELSNKISQEINSFQNSAEVKRIPHEEIKSYLQELGYRGELSQCELNIDEVFLKKLKSIIIQNRNFVNYLSNECDMNETGKIIKSKKISLDKMRDADIALKEKVAVIESEIKLCQRCNKNIEDQFITLCEKRNRLQDLLRRGEKMKNIFYNKQDFMNLENEYERKNTQKEDLEEWIRQYEFYMDVDEIDYSKLEETIQRKEMTIQKISKDIGKISLKIDQQKEQGDSFRILLLELSRLIEKHSEGNKHLHGCPVCGTTFSSNERLMNAINNQKKYIESTQHVAQSLIMEKDEKEKQMFAEKNSLKLLKDKKESIIQKRKAVVTLKAIMSIDESKQGTEIKEEVRIILAELQEWLANRVNQYNYAKRVLMDKELLDYPEKEEWISYLQKLIQQLNENIDTTQKLLKKQDIKEQELKEECQKLISHNVIFSEAEWMEYQMKTRGLEELNLIWKLDDDVPILHWLRRYDTLVQLVDYGEAMYEKQENMQFRKKQILELKKEKERLEIEYERCKVACDVIEKQKHLKDVMEDFLKVNAKQIELFFKLLHRPKEFGTLRIENGKICIVRLSNGQFVESKQMSTGQRMALAFSVMITLHLNATNAPNFLILDEPVANLDDMHVLNLIDLIREIALNGTQIIITTANDQITKFLRRKFSFLGEDYSHFELVRKGSKQTQIDVIHYSYDKKAESYRRRLDRSTSSVK